MLWPLDSQRAADEYGWPLTFLFLLVAVVISVVAGPAVFARSRRDDDSFSFSLCRVPDLPKPSVAQPVKLSSERRP